MCPRYFCVYIVGYQMIVIILNDFYNLVHKNFGEGESEFFYTFCIIKNKFK